jgi:hypothetical protein
MCPLQRGDLLHHVTGQLATVAFVIVLHFLVVRIVVGDSNGIVVWLDAWSFCRG